LPGERLRKAPGDLVLRSGERFKARRQFPAWRSPSPAPYQHGQDRDQNQRDCQKGH